MDARNLKTESVPLDAWFRKLTEFSKLQAEWDYYDALPISGIALQHASDFLHFLASDSKFPATSSSSKKFAPYHVAPLANGGIQMEWEGETDSLELEFQPDGSLRSMMIFGKQNDLHRRFHVEDHVDSDTARRAIEQIVES